ncbi:hypothetical protein CONCODRAFT_9154 [Conidiobolus coronatus NRRL 28638]|uniref:Uncharacterized protein n=1 Tax=Conidiobolus coronatus (strain ATCC 28846 / CBS 209.66 / NRRL 28638) TaxID=796925 RepID=A0A137P0E2_CONC2|nr:hypothetical protein CONCODRAFT_9154 [Conidiobolus coronatus NRRL 28638]|eukprot:KXN68560.1 hypothetical protein CONCODRAFT_9154 [Conidiobolus coronatus NRRL 28638]
MGVSQSSQRKRWMKEKLEHYFKSLYDGEVFVIIASVEQMKRIYGNNIDPETRGETYAFYMCMDGPYINFGTGCRLIDRCTYPIDEIEYVIIACKPGAALKVGDNCSFLGKYSDYAMTRFGEIQIFVI